MVPVVKKALTVAERQRKRTEKLQREGKYDVYKVRHANYGKIYRRKQNGILESTTAEEQLKSVSVRREKNKERKKRSREKAAGIATPQGANTKAYSRNSSLNRAVNTAKKSLPNISRKKNVFVRKHIHIKHILNIYKSKTQTYFIL